MAVNNSPLLTGKPVNGSNVWQPATTANTRNDGTGTIGTDMLLLYTADSTYGGFVQKVQFHPQAGTAATSTTATVVRVYISSQSTGATTNVNTRLIAEAACPAQTADQTTTATIPVVIPLGFAMKAGDSLLYSMHHAAAANTSWGAYAFAGNYEKIA